jgi:hypothetical protein
VKWNCPFFLHRGRPLCFFAAFKAHALFGFWGPAMKKVIVGDGIKTGRGLLGKLKSVEDLPDRATLLRYIKTAVKLHDSGQATPRAARKPRPAPPTPTDLAHALGRNARAAAYWQDLSPSGRREYIEWITEAKREETREKRLLTTLEWLAEGKPRHWKYQDC